MGFPWRSIYPIFRFEKGALTPMLMGASERLVTLSAAVGCSSAMRGLLTRWLGDFSAGRYHRGEKDSGGFAFPQLQNL